MAFPGHKRFLEIPGPPGPWAWKGRHRGVGFPSIKGSMSCTQQQRASSQDHHAAMSVSLGGSTERHVNHWAIRRCRQSWNKARPWST